MCFILCYIYIIIYIYYIFLIRFFVGIRGSSIFQNSESKNIRRNLYDYSDLNNACPIALLRKNDARNRC